MANREALRALQHRLAERMRVVRSEPQAQSWLAVRCAGQGLLFPLRDSGEIFDAQNLIAVPHARPWLVGVANLRGGLYTVIDLAGFLGLRAKSLGALPEQQRLVAFNAALGLNCAMVVDALEGLRHAVDMRREAAGDSPRPAFAVARWVDAAGRAWQEIGLSELATHETFLGIAG